VVASERSKRENRETNKPWVKRVPRLRRKSNSSHGRGTLSNGRERIEYDRFGLFQFKGSSR
jgi:hypothetical protein